MSLAVLQARLKTKKKVTKKKAKPKAKSKAKKKKPAKKKPKAKKKKATTKRNNEASGALGNSDITTWKDSHGSRVIKRNAKTKEQLVLAVLVRWWYAFEWPTAANLVSAREEMASKRRYRELGGMPGVFICILGEDTGKLIDKRDPKEGIMPTVKSMMKLSGSKLVDLWIKGLEGQIKSLKDSGNDNKTLLESLERELQNAKKADKEQIEKACQRQQKKGKK